MTDTNAGSATPDLTTYNPITFGTTGGTDSVFATIADINAFTTLQPDDQVLFRKGQIWHEQLTAPASGTSGHPITFGSYGSGNEPIISGANSLDGTWTAYPGNRIANSGFETWSGTTLGSWTAIAGVSSSISRDTTTIKYGSSSLLFQIGASNSDTYVQQSITGTTNTAYVFNIWYNIPVGKSAKITIRNNTTTNQLKSDSTWASGVSLTLTGTGEWTQYSITFTTESSGTTFTLTLERNSSASSSLYFDGMVWQPNIAQDLTRWSYRTGTYAPVKVWFSDILGTKQTSVANLTANRDWYDDGSEMWVYSSTSVDPSSIWSIDRTTRSYAVLTNKNYVTFDGLHLTKAGRNLKAGSTANTTGGSFINGTVDNSEYDGIGIGDGTGWTGTGWTIQNFTMNNNGQGTSGQYHGIYFSHTSNSTIANGVINNGGSAGWAIQIQDASDNNSVSNISSYNNRGLVVIWNNGAGFPTGNAVSYSICDTPVSSGLCLYVGGTATNAKVNSFFNNVVVNMPSTAVGLEKINDSTLTFKNNIIWSSDGTIIDTDTHTDLNSDYNVLGPDKTNVIRWNGAYYNTLSAYKTASNQDAHSVSSDPLFVNGTSDLSLQSSSPAIDAGTNVSLATDYAGNNIYGAPDIGAYEYQPPYTFSANNIPTTGSVRLYLNGQYRMTAASSTSATASFSVTPSGGNYYTASTSAYLEITIDSWQTTDTKNKQWTATSSADSVGYTHATSTVYTIGDLKPNVAYTFKLDGSASTTAIIDNAQCANSVCTANSSGIITFTYQGGYSTHTFALQDLTAPILTQTTAIATPSADTTPSYVFSSSEAGTLLYAGSCVPSSSTVISSGSNTVTFNALSDGVYTNCQISVIDNAANDSATTTLASFTIDTTTPTSAASISGATYTNIQSVSLSCTDATSGCNKIYYTTDGSTPTTNSQAYTTPINITSGHTILKFFAADLAGNSETTIHAENFTIILGSVSVMAPASADVKPPTIITAPNVQTVNNPANPRLENRENINQPAAATLKNILSEAKQAIGVNTASAKIILINFISQGTVTTKFLGSGERAGVVNSFKSAFSKSPQSETDWSDVIKIATGRWPSQKNQKTEANAKSAFKKIYLRNPNKDNLKDDAAIVVIAYGLRPLKRNLNSEQAAIKSFKAIYGYAPKSTSAWDIVRAIAYSGARR